MDLQGLVPLVIYDDQCYLCVKFAKVVNFVGRGKLALVGHYTGFGEKLRNEILDSSALEMFWFVDGKTAYGGRAALFPLFKALMSPKIKKTKGDLTLQEQKEEDCPTTCKSPKAVFLRSSSLLSNSKKIKLE